MGIPKFFRYISERYPLTSQLIQENKIPEFDNLYLDFNGIIHNCSHPNDDDAHFRLSEEQIFTSIFAYVDHLFSKIKPKKLFFIAVDGVAPRAKMNQQRSRRFRTAKEVREVREKAEAKGEKLPDEKAFDSNCITPGTPFMARLTDQLKYFINKKITEDSNWRNVEVVLSGHEVPGEGEHKIMEYIRLSRSQPDYNPNIRHCLYGLDADLVMLGLISHDPHFCLLREEVKFGPSSRKSKSNNSLESIKFYLLHLSLLREYLDIEFHSIAEALPFPYSLERVIDDFILLAVFVGNDFLPNLPDLHIHANGLEKLFEVYKKVLPSLEGYINDAGTIDLPRLQVVLNEMAQWEVEVFEKEYGDLNWFKGKQAKYLDQPKNANGNGNKPVLSTTQKEIFDAVKEWVESKSKEPLTMPNVFPAKDKKFISTLADDLHLSLAWDEYDEDGNNLVSFTPLVPLNGDAVDDVTASAAADDDEVNSSSSSEDEESQAAIQRVLNKYSSMPTTSTSASDFDTRFAHSQSLKMDEWKRHYYQGKLEISYDDPEQMHELVYRYVEGLQWVMHYYFSGVKSWGWFYDYHYAPRISDLSESAMWGMGQEGRKEPEKEAADEGGEGKESEGKVIKRGIKDFKFDFELGTPFRPFEQLMGVLPVASRELIPVAYRDLMSDPTSPILHFYPLEFESDLNGKKADWEAIVKIPFIDQHLLLKAMSSKEHLLTPSERARNSFGTSTKFTYIGLNAEPSVYPSSLPGFFPPLYRCMCKMETFDLPTLDPDLGQVLVRGLKEGVLMGKDALAGFPSLNSLPHTHIVLGYHHVNVHGSESRNQSVVVHILNTYDPDSNPDPTSGGSGSRSGWKTEDIGREFIGKRIFVGWPFISEGMVVAVSDSLFRYEKVRVGQGRGGGGVEKVLGNPHSQAGLGHWRAKAERIEGVYSKRFGIVTGPVEVLVHVRPLKGLKRLDDGSFIKDYEGQDKEVEQALQMVVRDVSCEDPRYVERPAPPLSEEFPLGSKIFFLGEHAYGVAAQVAATAETSLSVVLAFFPSDKTENAQFKAIVQDPSRRSTTYHPSFRVAEMLGMSGLALSRITSSFMVLTSDGQKHNVGLSLKFEAKSLKVVDYSKKDGRSWEFSEKAVGLIGDYKRAFPDLFGGLDATGDAIAKAAGLLPGRDPDGRVKEIRAWLKTKGVRDFEPVSLFCDQLGKETVKEIEKLADSFNANKSTLAIKKAIVKGIPRQAVLKPAHAIYRLQNQQFALGDRVTMIQDSGGVPLAAKGVVIGLNSQSMDVVWDVPFMSGTTLGDRCSQYRGSTVEFDTCLNLSNPQFVTSTNPKAIPAPAPIDNSSRFQPKFGPRPFVQPAPGQAPAAGFRPAPNNSNNTPVHIMTNPNRGGRREGFTAPPRGAPSAIHHHPRNEYSSNNNNNASASASGSNTTDQPPVSPGAANVNGDHRPASNGGFGASRGMPHSRGVKGFGNGRGRGFGSFNAERGRGGPRGGGYRGRGRAAPLPS